MKTTIKKILAAILISGFFSTAQADFRETKLEVYSRTQSARGFLFELKRSLETDNYEMTCFNIGFLTKSLYSVDQIAGIVTGSNPSLYFGWETPKLLAHYCDRRNENYHNKEALRKILFGPTDDGSLPFLERLQKIEVARQMYRGK